MNRKPVDNGLKGVPLKRQISSGDLQEQSHEFDMFQGNADMRDVVMDHDQAPNRFSFEIMAGSTPKKGLTGSALSPFQQRAGASTGGDDEQNHKSDCETAHIASLTENAIKVTQDQEPSEEP